MDRSSYFLLLLYMVPTFPDWQNSPSLVLFFHFPVFFSRASAKAERDLSSLSCMCVYVCVCVCVDQNKATPSPSKGNFDVYRFDLTKLTPPPAKISQIDAFHHITPSLLKEISMSTDLTWPSWPPPPWPKFHRCIPSHYTYPLQFHRCIPSCYPYPPGQNFTDAFYHATATSQLKFHRCIPICGYCKGHHVVLANFGIMLHVPIMTLEHSYVCKQLS